MQLFNRQLLGQQAEHDACEFLREKGLILLQKNFHCYYGEIDLIMRDQKDLVFIEVRSRSRRDYGSALESITKNKVTKLIKTATYFLQQQNLPKTFSRFDIIVIDTHNQQLEWIKNAFSV